MWCPEPIFCCRLVKCESSVLLWNIKAVVCSFVPIALAKNIWSSACNLKIKWFSVCCHSPLKPLREVGGHYVLASPLLLCTLFHRKFDSPFKPNVSFTIIPVSLKYQCLCVSETWSIHFRCHLQLSQLHWTQWGKKNYFKKLDTASSFLKLPTHLYTWNFPMC